jgi:hypothetical protein
MWYTICLLIDVSTIRHCVPIIGQWCAEEGGGLGVQTPPPPPP